MKKHCRTPYGLFVGEFICGHTQRRDKDYALFAFEGEAIPIGTPRSSFLDHTYMRKNLAFMLQDLSTRDGILRHMDALNASCGKVCYLWIHITDQFETLDSFEYSKEELINNLKEDIK